MINIHLNLTNPFSNRFGIVKSLHGLLSKNKAWEFNIYKVSSVVSVGFNLTFRCDHAGLRGEISLLGYEIEANVYDTRHWDYETNTWEKYDSNDNIE
jgi:hypothetical protein